MAAIRRSISVAILILGSFGAAFYGAQTCGHTFNWEGTWEGKRGMALRPNTPTDIANSVQRIRLIIKPGGEYELDASGVPSRGAFHTSGNDATLEPVTLLDRNIENPKPIAVKANSDGTITLASPDSLDSKSIVLRRESQPTDSNVRNR